MRPFNQREPGIIGATLDEGSVVAELICDGVHVHPAALRLALRSKLPDRVVLVTDGTGLEGSPDGIYTYRGDDTPIHIKDGRATLEDGTIAGSTMRMNRQIRFLCQQVGISLTEAVRMCTKNAAHAIGATSKGELVQGKDADFVVLDDNFDVSMVSVMGHIMEVPR
jgi:N-acetylglucosamine-6-phosphate deacetylase